MNFIDTFSTYQNIDKEKKQALYMAVFLLLIAAKENASTIQLCGNCFFEEFPWEVLLDREKMDEFFSEKSNRTNYP